MKRRKILIAAGIVLLAVLIASAYIYKEYNRKYADTATLHPDYVLSAASLLNHFAHDSALSSQKYMNRLLQVSGVVKQVERIDDKNVVMVLGDSTDRSAVRCNLDSVHQSAVMRTRVGQTATVKGVCSGFNQDELLGSDVILIRCALVTDSLTVNKN
ncbi:MAG: hypothetical protein KA821_11255 [Chitinophagaceae bacterium]|nr:hypothetical protein [Chitinophagaceae bacterium]